MPAGSHDVRTRSLNPTELRCSIEASCQGESVAFLGLPQSSGTMGPMVLYVRSGDGDLANG